MPLINACGSAAVNLFLKRQTAKILSMIPARLQRYVRIAFRTLCMCVFIAAIGLWVRSCGTVDLITHASGDGRYFEVVTIPAQIRLTWATGWIGQSPWRWRHGKEQLPPALPVLGQRSLSRKWYRFGSGVRTFVDALPAPWPNSQQARRMTVRYHIFALPLAVPALLAAIPFAWGILRRGHNKRLRQFRLVNNLCPQCAYDLRASSGRCPECGSLIPKKSPSLPFGTERGE